MLSTTIKHVATENRQPHRRCPQLVEVCEVLAGQSAPRAEMVTNLTQDKPDSINSFARDTDRESNVVPDLHDEVRVSGLGITELNQIVHRAATGLLHHAPTCQRRVPARCGHHVATLGVDA